MKTLRLNRWNIILPILAWWLLFSALSIFDYNRFQVLNIVGFPFLAIIPGLLTLVSARVKNLPFWAYATLSVGFSILELMLMGLIGNTFLPFAGIARPLDKPVLLLELYPLIVVLITIAWLRIEPIEIMIKRYLLSDSMRDFILSLTPILFVVMSILGAIRLNNGGSNIFTITMLGAMGVYIIFLMYYAKNIGESVIPTALFFMASALLLMTDLRGWYITGHDIQSEYRVFQITKSAGLWSMAAYRDAYNACLSITILPTIFSNLLQVPDPYIFKFFFQLFFALVPVLVYLIGRHWTPPRIAFLGTIYFIAFPTFFTDMPFLVRQEIAFLFFGLMLYIIFEKSLDLRLRQLLFLLMGIGVVLAHYSTTYTVLVILGFAVISGPIFRKMIDWVKDKPFYQNSALGSAKIEGVKITFAMVLVLFALSFTWTTIITNTGSNVTNVLGQTFEAVKDGFAGNNRSIDVSTLLSFSKPNQNQELEEYIQQDVDPIRASSTTGTYFSEQTYDQYPITATSSGVLPLTSLGNFAARIGINAPQMVTLFGELLAKLTELLVPLGMIYLVVRKSRMFPSVDPELYLIGFFCLVFIGLNIVLPVLSTQYGIFRALQQSMFVIAPIIIAGAVLLGDGIALLLRPFTKRFSGATFAMILTSIFFFYSTYFIPYLFGGNLAQLHLSNTGTYYDDYLIQASEVYGVNWLTATANTDAVNGVRFDLQTDGFTDYEFASLTGLGAYGDIFPPVIQRTGYVFLAPTVAVNDRASVIYNADPVSYAYPLQFLEDNKSLIYNNGEAEVYR